MRVLVCGGRDYNNSRKVADILSAIHKETPITHLIHGGARGADTCAAMWASNYTRIRVIAHPADWAKHGKSAGPLRNRAMLLDEPDLVVAFPGGAGTEDMVQRAYKAGVPIRRVRS